MAQLNLSLDKMPARSRELYDQLKVQRGSLDDMYVTLLNHPDLAEHVSQLGTYLRFEATLPGDIREVLTLLTAHSLGAEYEWLKHVPAARTAGVSDSVIAAIRADRPLAELNGDYGVAEAIHQCLVQRRSIPPQLQDRAIAKWGICGILESVVLVGFYSLIAGILFAFDVPTPKIEGGQ